MFSKKFLISQVFFVAVALVSLVLYFKHSSGQPAVYGQVKNFQLVNSDNQAIGLKELRGKVWVADFFFTTCGDVCPMMSSHMGRLQEVFKPYKNVRLVSFTVNPENDTPQALKVYAKKFKADPKRWIFLTGSREELTRVAVESFKLGDINQPIFHSSYFVLVDYQGRIRGYYESKDSKNIDKIIQDLRQIL